MNNLNDVDKADTNVCPPFKDNCVEPNYDTSIEPSKGIIYPVVACGLFWIGIFYLIRWLY